MASVSESGRWTRDDPSDSSGPSPEIVKTKLSPPSSRTEEVLRPDLLELLDAGSVRKLTLIGAPAGYGKTTLLSQWRRSQEPNLPVAWVSLDEQDNDPIRLWKHIIEALDRVTPEGRFGADFPAGLGIVATNLVETTLPVLINSLAELPRRVALVLDDYQWITKSDCHETVAFLVEHLPQTVHLVISTRSDPPLGLGRLRARGEINELRIEQLAFSEEEAASLLGERLGLNIGRADLALLLERTEGWPAGIYLAALSMRGRDAHAFVSSLRGSSRYIVDVLTEEVLASLSEEERRFMIRTSVLEKMSGSLCDEVLGMEGSGKILRELGHSNLLVVPLDDSGRWYRYHRLFADFLLYELENTNPKLVPVLHGRASVWFEREGQLEKAIEHAAAAGEYERAGQLIARHWFGYVVTGQMATLRGWLEALPQDFVDRAAPLALVEAWICALYGQREETERFLALAEYSSSQGKLPDGTPSVEAGVTLVRGFFGYGGVRAWVRAAERAAELESGQVSARDALVHIGLGMGRYCSGDNTRARSLLEEGLRLTKDDQPLLRLAMLSFLSFVVLDEGHPKEAESLAHEACALVDRFKLQGIPQASLACIALGRVLAKRGNLAEAQTELENGLSPRRRLPGMSPWPTLVGLLALAQVRIARGDQSEARAVLAEARAIVETYPDAGIFPDLLNRQERKLRRSKPSNGSLDEQLTKRELDVLRHLDDELTVSELGKLLYVAPNTVRTHVKSIYRKLGVSSRKEAVEQAYARKLI
jgi:LuxR family transcriptional regulator, maltose regulon positive regulatory protein